MKSLRQLGLDDRKRRSREGAWIEINDSGEQATGNTSVAPARERGLKFSSSEDAYKKDSVAPARERGLKYFFCSLNTIQDRSLPRGSVD